MLTVQDQAEGSQGLAVSARSDSEPERRWELQSGVSGHEQRGCSVAVVFERLSRCGVVGYGHFGDRPQRVGKLAVVRRRVQPERLDGSERRNAAIALDLGIEAP